MKKAFSVFAVILMLAVSSTVGATGSSEEKAASAVNWPSRDIQIICGMGAGGDTDLNARLLSRYLEKELNVSVPVSNVTGGNGTIAGAQYKDGTPDGYTFFTINTVAISANEATGLANFGYAAFEPVAIFGKHSGDCILVPGDSPYNTLQDLINAVKAKPNTIRFGVSTGSAGWVALVVLAQAGNAQFIPMESGDGPARVTALLGGHLDATITSYGSVKDLIEAKKLKALATLWSESPALISEIPPVQNVIPELHQDPMHVLFAPKNTPPEIVEAMNKAIQNVVRNPEFRAEFEKLNLQNASALGVNDTIKELESQRKSFMSYSQFLKE
jgi:tripartite-type tricarboxylate transporter receptor subunit TctC